MTTSTEQMTSPLPAPPSRSDRLIDLASGSMLLGACLYIIVESGKDRAEYLDQVSRVVANAAQIEFTTPDGNTISLDAPSAADRKRIDSMMERSNDFFDHWRDGYGPDSTITIRDKDGEILCKVPLKPNSFPIVMDKAAVQPVLDDTALARDIAALCKMDPLDVHNRLHACSQVSPDSSITYTHRDGTVDTVPLAFELKK